MCGTMFITLHGFRIVARVARPAEQKHEAAPCSSVLLTGVHEILLIGHVELLSYLFLCQSCYRCGPVGRARLREKALFANCDFVCMSLFVCSVLLLG